MRRRTAAEPVPSGEGTIARFGRPYPRFLTTKQEQLQCHPRAPSEGGFPQAFEGSRRLR